MSGMRVIATGLRFPEGPVAMQDGSVVLVEIERQTISRVLPDGAVAGDRPHRRRAERRWRSVRTARSTSATTAASPGDWRMNLCGRPWPASDYNGGRIQRVDPNTGAVTRAVRPMRRHTS